MDGKALKKIIEGSNLTYNEIARRMGTTGQILQSVFNSKNVSSEKIEKIAAAIGWPVSRLYGESSVNTANSNVTASSDYTNIAYSEALSKALDEIAAQRKIIERLLSILEKSSQGNST